ncbi:protocadherin-8-like isoform X2 [Hyperolius riggenbachi]|uniref:protocadherin-8-like isoform X2 n=1 Tax=Hyperolius riggenbachi TaxID=752182 RepID=UPI0035A32D2C
MTMRWRPLHRLGAELLRGTCRLQGTEGSPRNSDVAPISDWQQEKRAGGASLRPEQFSAKDSGRGDSDFNDSSSDTSREGVSKAGMLTTQDVTGAPYNGVAAAAAANRVTEAQFSHRSNRSLQSGHYTIQYQKEYAVSYTMSPPYYNTYHPRAQNARIPHYGPADSYYHVSHPPAHHGYERDLPYHSATLSPSRVGRAPQQLPYRQEAPPQGRLSDGSSHC